MHAIYTPFCTNISNNPCFTVSLLNTNYLVLVPTDPDFIPPTDTHGRAAELLRVWLPDAADVSVETRDTVDFVDPGGNWEGVACPACGADARHARVGRGHEPRLSRRLWLCRAACEKRVAVAT